MQHNIDVYNDYALRYADLVVAREKAGGEREHFTSHLLAAIGDVAGLQVLDAGCGEGYLSRILTRHGASVTGIDIASRLVEIARIKDPEGQITYQVVDLCKPLPEYQDHFDLVASFFVLNDVYDYQGFLATLASVTRPGGRLVFFMNSPYSYVMRGHLTDYFDTGKAFSYRGLAEAGVKVHYYHHTLEEYLDASLAAELQLQHLIDVPTPEGTFKRSSITLHPEGYHFPYFMILSFLKS